MTADPTRPTDTITLRTGTTMPVLGLGTWELTEDTADTVAEALHLGYRMIDTADDYGSQPGIAQALAGSEIDRGDVYLVSKVEEDEDALAAARDRLQQLQVDQVDLLLLHRPPPEGAGVELWRGLQRARDEGLTVDIGVSNYAIDLLDQLVEESGEVPAVNQVEWTPFGWSASLLERCTDLGIALQAYSPLTRGRRLDDPTVGEIADHHDKDPAQVLLRWDLQRGVVPLPKANRPDHLRANLDVFDFSLSPDEIERLDRCNQHESALSDAPLER